MIYGMGTVFVFLALLIAATVAMSILTRRFSPAAVKDPAAASDTDLIKAGVAAATLHHHRKQQGK